MCMNCTFFCSLATFSGRESFLALSAAGHAGGPRVHYGACLSPGRAPWRVLWASKIARAGPFSRDRFPPSQSQAGRWKPKQKNYKSPHQVFACSAVYNSSHLAWSRGHLAPRLSSRLSSRATAVTLRAHLF
ncbi:unnamed protein product, partial [Laminaria digitata]